MTRKTHEQTLIEHQAAVMRALEQEVKELLEIIEELKFIINQNQENGIISN